MFHSMKEEETKFDPLAVIVIAELPGAAEVGLIEVSDGTGFGVAGALGPVFPLVLPPPPHPRNVNAVETRHSPTPTDILRYRMGLQLEK